MNNPPTDTTTHNFNFENGETLLIDKPLHWTSFDVVNKIRYATRTKKVGHAGTLDPLATGLLIICTGKNTKTIDQIQGLSKVYTGIFQLGATTASYDAETPIQQTFDTQHLTTQQILNTAPQFVGNILQTAPAFSAIKVNGKKLYEQARKGKETPKVERPVTIHQFNITNIELPFVHFEVHCSKGTYIRALAHDFGQALQNGAFLKELRRTQIGNFNINQAYSLPQFLEIIKTQQLPTPNQT